MSEKIVIAGVGMIPFKKPGQSDSYDVMGAAAVRKALTDAGIGYDQVQSALRKLCLRRQLCRSGGPLSGGDHRYPHRERQQ